MNGLLEDGLAAMCVGMGTVLTFLCVLIAAMSVMSYVVRKLNKIFPEAAVQVAGVKKAVSSNDEEVALAIAAALYRKK